jgi:hypothetical protein
MTGKPPLRLRDVPRSRYDERDIAFSRIRLVPGTAEYTSYYALRPENRKADDEVRALPGLLSPEASMADPALFAAAEGAFFLTGQPLLRFQARREAPSSGNDSVRIGDSQLNTLNGIEWKEIKGTNQPRSL